MPSSAAARSRLSLAALAALLLLGSAASLHLSHCKLFWQDELFEFFSDSRPTLGAVLRGQRLAPFSLEPPAFHLLLHLLLRLPLRPEISLRLPSALGLLLTQLSAFLLTRRLARSRSAALLAAALPLVLATLDYSAEARVYSLLTGTYALAFLSYGKSHAPSGRTHLLPPLGLFLSLGSCVLLHFFGVLLPLPFLLAELCHRPRSRSTLLAVLASLAAFVLNLPFLPAAREIQRLYFDSGEARSDMTLFTYVWLVLRSRITTIREHGGAMPVLLCVAAAVCLVTALLLLFRRLQLSERDSPDHPGQLHANDRPLLLALGAGLLLPILAVLVGMHTSHAYSPRYSLPAVVPVVILAALFCEPLLRRFRPLLLLLPLTLSIGLAKAIHQAAEARHDARQLRDSLVLSPALARVLQAAPDAHLYLQDTARFLPALFYAPADSRSRLVLLQSVAGELRWSGSAVSGLFARNMSRSTALPVTTWEIRAQDPHPFLLVLYGTGPEWLSKELPATGRTPEDLGPALGGELLRVSPVLPSAPLHPRPTRTRNPPQPHPGL